jgi:hypothetical protein
MKITKYRLKKAILWYPKGTEFETSIYEHMVWWYDFKSDKKMRTFDELQLAIASHADDKGANLYYKKVLVIPDLKDDCLECKNLPEGKVVKGHYHRIL